MIHAIIRAFRPLDTSEADAAIAEAQQSVRAVAVRARALRMDVCCGDPAAAIQFMTDRIVSGAGHLLRAIYEPAPSIPADMQDLLDKL